MTRRAPLQLSLTGVLIAVSCSLVLAWSPGALVQDRELEEVQKEVYKNL